LETNYYNAGHNLVIDTAVYIYSTVFIP